MSKAYLASVLSKGTLAKTFRKQWRIWEVFKGQRKQVSPKRFTKPDSNAGKFQLKTRKQLALRSMWPVAKISRYTLPKQIIYKATI